MDRYPFPWFSIVLDEPTNFSWICSVSFVHQDQAPLFSLCCLVTEVIPAFLHWFLNSAVRSWLCPAVSSHTQSSLRKTGKAHPRHNASSFWNCILYLNVHFYVILNEIFQFKKHNFHLCMYIWCHIKRMDGCMCFYRFHYAARIWDGVKKSSALSEYSRLLS